MQATGLVVGAPWGVASLLPETRRKLYLERLLGMDDPSLGNQLILCLGVVWIGHAAVDRADRRALFLVEEAHALGAFRGDDVIDVLGERRLAVAAVLPLGAALVDRRVRALGLACAAVDALLGDHRGHGGRTLQCTGYDDNLRMVCQAETPTTGACGAQRTSSATRRARARNLRLAGCPGSAATMGRP